MRLSVIEKRNEAIRTCLSCTLHDCQPDSKNCPYNQRFGKGFEHGSLRQESCGYREAGERVGYDTHIKARRIQPGQCF